MSWRASAAGAWLVFGISVFGSYVSGRIGSFATFWAVLGGAGLFVLYAARSLHFARAGTPEFAPSGLLLVAVAVQVIAVLAPAKPFGRPVLYVLSLQVAVTVIGLVVLMILARRGAPRWYRRQLPLLCGCATLLGAWLIVFVALTLFINPH